MFTVSRLANIWHSAVERLQSAPAYTHTFPCAHVYRKVIGAYKKVSLAIQEMVCSLALA